MATTKQADQPLGKPRGTVRSYLAIGIVGTFLASHAVAAVVLAVSGNVDAALGLLGALGVETGGVTGYYFASRAGA